MRKPKASRWNTVVQTVKQAVEAAVSPERAYAEHILAEPPPESPRAPYTPEPPNWMIEPVLVRRMDSSPAYWSDEAPFHAWEQRRGRALYELRKEDMRDRLRMAGEESEEDHPAWAGPPPPGPRTPLSALNHRANLLTVKQRQERGLTAPWNRRPTPKPPTEEELPEAECGWAPWWCE